MALAAFRGQIMAAGAVQSAYAVIISARLVEPRFTHNMRGRQAVAVMAGCRTVTIAPVQCMTAVAYRFASRKLVMGGCPMNPVCR